MKNQSGQSLIEVVVAVGMMALLLVALLALITISIKNSRLAKNRAQAVSLSQGGIELLRSLRDYSWEEFVTSAGVTRYQLPQNWVVEDGLSQECDSINFTIYDIFSRCVQLTLISLEAVEVEVTSYWQEGPNLKIITQTTRLSKWER